MTKKKSAVPDRIRELESELLKLRTIQDQEIINIHYPKIKEKYEGKYFKYNNGYNNKERWWLYRKVIEIKPEDVYVAHDKSVNATQTGWEFETNTLGEITINLKARGYVSGLGREISEEEFNTAWNKMIEKLNSLK